MDYEGAFFNSNDYELTKQSIGHGNFGTVYVAKRKKDGKNFAVKVIKTEGGFNGDMQMQLMRESMILRELHHPSIIQFIGINFQSFSDPSKLEPSIITEYLSHGSLKDILDKEKQSLSEIGWDSTKKYISLLGIASAMKYLHQNHIIHRDLKPQNVIMDENYYPRVCDFGLSRCIPKTSNNSNGMTSQIGTPLYMAPELLRGDTNYDETVDVYAFAILAYEIVTGNEPYSELGKNVTPFVLANKVMSGYRPKFPNSTNAKMIDLLSSCWSENANERPSFEKIYTLLSNDFSYFDETIDEEEVNGYIENMLDMVLKNSKYNPDEDFFQALALLHGVKEKRNFDEAVTNLKYSAEKGSSLSSHLLALLYESGDIEKDFEKAEFYYRKSAEQGNSNALQRLGLCYTKSYGVECDSSKAIECFQKSAELGNSRALCNLGMCYQKGIGADEDLYKGFEFINRSAELGNPIGLCNLAICYEKGKGVAKDLSKAIELYEKSGELGDTFALYFLASCYENGKGVPEDMNKAIEYYMKAGELGHENSLYHLAFCYEKGNGVPQDVNKAIELYEKCAKSGNILAKRKIEKLKK
ncbi:hypothetical protein M9Y10_019728 [Tritrichomonas musculus]|uniref:Protein kinase domain-containing protein n=1 Tax=Tritrichomonas musculus TaxID=1915356 RepID=A0ABR2HJE1_9EUKA